MRINSKFRLPLATISMSLLLAACDNDNDPVPTVAAPPPPPPAMASFEVTVTNLTNAQPLSPVAVLAHDTSFRVFDVGTTATLGLETLAEGGDNSELILEASTAGAATFSGAAPIGPSGSETITFSIEESLLADSRVSVASMLVNTNDAFFVAGFALADVSVGDTLSQRSIVYDAGTELNDELAGNIPGPAGGGEGFNAARNDRADFVTMHPGVVSSAGGLPSSELGEEQRFDNPAAAVVLTRTQ